MARVNKASIVIGVIVGVAVIAMAYMAWRSSRRREGVYPALLGLLALKNKGKIGVEVPFRVNEQSHGYSKAVDRSIGNKIQVFADSNFTKGTNLFDPPHAVHDLHRFGWGDKMSSIQIPPGRTVRLWTDVNAKGQVGGAFLDLPPGYWDLWQLGFNDRTSAMMSWTGLTRADYPPAPIKVPVKA